MEHPGIVESTSLLLIITYYTRHCWREFKHEWRCGKRRLQEAGRERHWREFTVLLGMLALTGCVQAGPALFYLLHLPWLAIK